VTTTEPENEEGFTINEVARMFNDPATFPVVDADRSESDREDGRQIIEEFGEIQSYFPARDWWGRVPVRLTVNQSAGFIIEVGTMDLAKAEIDVLKQAIAAWEDMNF
jgi:hypothetical protein